jgi:subtilisin family serine protease
MKPRSLLLVALAAALGACASLHPAAAPGNASDVARASTANVASMDSERDIVLAVANPLEPTAANAGSSLLGYSPSRYYGAGQRATSTLAALKQSYRLRDITGWPIKALGVYCVVFEPPAGTSRESLLKALAADARVQLAQPLHDYAVYAAASPGIHHYSDPYVDLQRGFAETDAAAAQLVSQGRGVHIAIVDTGVDLEHVDLRGRIRDAHNLVDDDASAFSRDSHGTEVAGVVAATADNHQGIVGMAPRATLSVYKACWYALAAAGARCNTFTLAKALAGIVDTDARVINLSLGGALLDFRDLASKPQIAVGARVAIEIRSRPLQETFVGEGKAVLWNTKRGPEPLLAIQFDEVTGEAAEILEELLAEALADLARFKPPPDIP